MIWQETQLPIMVNADKLDVFWGANGLLPTIRTVNCATVVTIHDLVYKFAAKTQPKFVKWSRSIFQPRSCRTATRIIAVSHATANDVEKLYRTKVHAVIHPQIDDRFRPATRLEIQRVREKHSLPEDFLLTVGTLEPRKNIENLVIAYLRTIESGHRLPTLVIAGGAGWLNENAEAVISNAVAGGHVVRLGFVNRDDLPALYSACSCFIMPSKYEGYGMPITEAQFCGARVIHGNHPSMIEAGGNLGYAFEPSHDGMCKMLANIADSKMKIEQRELSEYNRSPLPAAQMLWDTMCDAASRFNSLTIRASAPRV